MWLSNWVIGLDKKNTPNKGEKWYFKTDDPFDKWGIYIRDVKNGYCQFSYMYNFGVITDGLYSDKISVITRLFEKE